MAYESARLKLARAREHLTDLDRESRAWADTQPYWFRVERDIEAGQHVVRVRARQPPLTVPARLGILAGDAAHTLRCALDHLAYELAGDSASIDTQRPILDARSAWDGFAARRLSGVPTEALEVMLRFQPYLFVESVMRGEDLTDDSPLSLIHLLSGIARLDNLDKHRVVPAVLPFLRWRDPEFSGVRRVEGTYPAEAIAVVEGAEVFRITRVDLIPGQPFAMTSVPPYSVAFGSSGTVDWSEVLTNRSIVSMSQTDIDLAAGVVESIIRDVEQLG